MFRPIIESLPGMNDIYHKYLLYSGEYDVKWPSPIRPASPRTEFIITLNDDTMVNYTIWIKIPYYISSINCSTEWVYFRNVLPTAIPHPTIAMNWTTTTHYG